MIKSCWTFNRSWENGLWFLTSAYQTPPECIGVGLELLVWLFFHRVDQKRSQDETEKAYVPGRDELLWEGDTVSLWERGDNKASSETSERSDKVLTILDAIMGLACPLWHTRHFRNVFYFPWLCTCCAPTLFTYQKLQNTHIHTQNGAHYCKQIILFQS